MDRLPGSTDLHLAIGLPLHNTKALTNLLQQIYDPASPHYHQYLTAEQFTEMFGPTEQEYQTLIAFAQTNGFTITGTHPNRVLLDVSSPVTIIERTFNVNLLIYPHPTESRRFHAPDVEPSVPVGIPVLDISGLDDFMPPRPMNLKRVALDANQQVQAYATGSGPGGDFLGNDFRNAYAPGVSLTGVGQVIGLFEFGPYFTNDIILYKQAAALPDVVVTNVLLDGFTGIPAPGADDGEEALDIDMAMAMAPGATIIVYEGNSAMDIFNRMATDNKAKQMSCSFGFYPPFGTMDNIFLEYAAQGQNLFVASGDGGAYSTNTIFAPADDPNIVAVGGTDLTTGGKGGPWQSETTWIGSGGGITPHYSIPSWQMGMNMSTNHGSTTQRNFPDVAILADTVIFWYLKNGQSGTVGGTSAAAPLWAGFMALANQQAAANGRPPVGFLNPIIYGIGKTNSSYPTLFHDITTGNNTNKSSPTNFFAVAGYDLATGWGSPNGSNLINFLAAPTDNLQITPGIGFTTLTPFALPFGATNVTFSLTNAGGSSLNWSLASTSVWLNVSSSSGTLAAAENTTVTVSLNTLSATNLPAGTYYSYVFITNTTSSVVQNRLFTLSVSPADFPITVSGFNASVIVPNNATVGSPQAVSFDTANNSFFQAGVNTNAQFTGSGLQLGVPKNGGFTSALDGTTAFQFGPYGGGANVLLVGRTFSSSGTLTMTAPQSYNSIALLATSANGGADGTCVINFTNGTTSQTFNFHAQDWFNTTANVAIQGFGRLDISTLVTEDDTTGNPNFYQTTINLAALGLNQPISSIRFTKPNASGITGVFALSGALMSPQPVITQQPQSVTNSNPSSSSTMTVTAMGAPPLSYQWYSPTGAISGANSASLVFNAPVQTNLAGNYFAVVTNGSGTITSSVAALTIYRVPQITQEPAPTNIFLYVGASVGLSVTGTGATPLNYYWNTNGTPIPGATSPAYTLSNAQLANSGSYTMVLSNAFGMVTSSSVSITVLATPVSPYTQAVLTDHPVGYWRLDEPGGTIAHDYLTAKNGTYNSVTLNQAGYNPADSDTAAKFGPAINSYVGGIPSIDFATSGSATFSVEAWVKGSAQTVDAGIITKGTGAGGEQFNLDIGAGNHSLFRFFVRDATATARLANGSLGPNGSWHHVVGVCDQPNGNVYLYVDGVFNASGTITAGAGLLSSSNAVSIGSRQSGTTTYDNQFNGTLDEVAIYNYALSASQVAAHYDVRTNWPPSFTSNPFSEPNANAGQSYAGSIAGSATDPNGGTLTYSKDSGPAWLSVASNGALSGTPANSDANTNTFTVRVTDSTALSNSATMYITVTAAPAMISTISFDGVNFVLTWSGGIAPYQVQMSTNLADANWINVGAPLGGNTITITPSNDAAFYRIIGQ